MEPVRYENGHKMLIAGLAGNFSGETARDIPALWMRFAPHIGKLKSEVGTDAYGVMTGEMSGENRFRYLSGVEVKSAADLPKDFETIDIPAQRYAVFQHADHVSKLSETIGKIWHDWWPKSGLSTPARQICSNATARNSIPRPGSGAWKSGFRSRPKAPLRSQNCRHRRA